MCPVWYKLNFYLHIISLGTIVTMEIHSKCLKEIIGTFNILYSNSICKEKFVLNANKLMCTMYPSKTHYKTEHVRNLQYLRGWVILTLTLHTCPKSTHLHYTHTSKGFFNFYSFSFTLRLHIWDSRSPYRLYVFIYVYYVYIDKNILP